MNECVLIQKVSQLSFIHCSLSQPQKEWQRKIEANYKKRVVDPPFPQLEQDCIGECYQNQEPNKLASDVCIARDFVHLCLQCANIMNMTIVVSSLATINLPFSMS